MARTPCPSDRNPHDDDPGFSALQEEVHDLLDGACIPQEHIDLILAAVAKGEEAREEKHKPTRWQIEEEAYCRLLAEQERKAFGEEG